MELPLPEELGRIVNGYAKPYCAFWREYRKAMRLLGRDEWPLLLKMLSDTDADVVLEALECYVAAFVDRKAADEEVDQYRYTVTTTTRELQESWAEIARLRKELRHTTWVQDITYRDLMILMLGEETVDREGLAPVDEDYEYEE